jgi:hypothetical protein
LAILNPHFKLTMRSTFFAFITTLAFVAGASVAWQQWGGENARPANSTEGSKPEQQANSSNGLPKNKTTPAKPKAKHADPFAEPVAKIARLTADEIGALEVPSRLLEQTSWQNPFQPNLWKIDGARIDENSLAFQGTGRALFLRSYSQLMVEFQINTSTSEAKSNLNLSIELFKPTQDEGVVVHFRDGECQLESHLENSEPSMLKRQTIGELGEASHVRVNIMPNRIMVGWNGRVVINSPRPTPLVNSQLYLHLINQQILDEPTNSNSVVTIISDMRIEGE